MKTGGLRILDSAMSPNFEAIWISTWAEVAPKWVQVAGSWSRLVQVGPKLGPGWLKLPPSRANVAAMLDRNGPFGRFWADLQDAYITTVPCDFWRLASFENAPS